MLLPAELMTDILCRLPVKSLLRFRCVSKPWWSLIDSPDFIKLHLKTNTNHSLILAYGVEFFSVVLDTIDIDTDLILGDQDLDTAINLNNPIDTGDGAWILGSCNGLVALTITPQYLCLWNPSARKSHQVPVTPIEFPWDLKKSIGYGFGYDPVSDDYKLVVMVLLLYQDLIKSQVEVYSLKSNSWRQTSTDFPYYQCYHKHEFGILANNTLHWMMIPKSKRDSAHLIVAFDLRVEKYFEVPQPDYTDNNCCTRMNVESLGGCLSVVCHYVQLGVDVWVMKEYGVKESWTKLFSVALNKDNLSWIMKPLAYSNRGDRVLLDGDKKSLVWYGLRRKRAHEFRIPSKSYGVDVEMFVTSLVRWEWNQCHEATSTSGKQEVMVDGLTQLV